MQRNKKKREAESRELGRDTQRDGHMHRNRIRQRFQTKSEKTGGDQADRDRT